jgi:hypothetical protein
MRFQRYIALFFLAIYLIISLAPPIDAFVGELWDASPAFSGKKPGLSSIELCMANPGCAAGLAGEVANAASAGRAGALVAGAAAGGGAALLWGLDNPKSEELRKKARVQMCLQDNKACSTGLWVATFQWAGLPSKEWSHIRIKDPVGLAPINSNYYSGSTSYGFQLYYGHSDQPASQQVAVSTGQYYNYRESNCNSSMAQPPLICRIYIGLPNYSETGRYVYDNTVVNFRKLSDGSTEVLGKTGERKGAFTGNTATADSGYFSGATSGAGRTGDFWKGGERGDYNPSAQEIQQNVSQGDLLGAGTSSTPSNSSEATGKRRVVQDAEAQTQTQEEKNKNTVKVKVLTDPYLLGGTGYQPGDPILKQCATCGPSPSPSPSPSTSPSPSPSPDTSPSPSPSLSPSPSPDKVDYTWKEPTIKELEPKEIKSQPWPKHAIEVFSRRFPFDILSDIPILGSDECPVYVWFGQITELCWLKIAIESLRIPIIFGICIISFWRS